jgi:hypothetical protein
MLPENKPENSPVNNKVIAGVFFFILSFPLILYSEQL